MKHSAGITLVELLIAVAIVSILATVAYPNYRSMVMRTHRAEGKAALLDTQQRMEKCYTRLHTYNGCGLNNYATEAGRYFIEITPLDQAFTLTATPRGAQAADAACGTLSVDQRGRKGKTGTAPLADCWQK